MPVADVYHLVELKKQKTKCIDWKYDLLLEHSFVKSKFSLLNFPVDAFFCERVINRFEVIVPLFFKNVAKNKRIFFYNKSTNKIVAKSLKIVAKSSSIFYLFQIISILSKLLNDHLSIIRRSNSINLRDHIKVFY